jgi:hypothetical protein
MSMVEPEHRDLEVPEADEIEQHTPLFDTDADADARTAAAPTLPDEAAEGDALDQTLSVQSEDEYPPG